MASTVLDPKYLREHLKCGTSIMRYYHNDLGSGGVMKLIRINDDSVLGFARVLEPESAGKKIYVTVQLGGDDKRGIVVWEVNGCFTCLENVWQKK